ncbi:MAG: Ig-like domain-containing protein [Lachnospiraceae bacterium]|nr:Ig-like domain-containing protein [Lachnospiraceae bacterium]
MKMRRTRVLSVILALSMVFSTPFSVAAAEDEIFSENVAEDAVTVEEAVAVEENGEDLPDEETVTDTVAEPWILTLEVAESAGYAVLTGQTEDLPEAVEVCVYAEDSTLFEAQLPVNENGEYRYELPLAELLPGGYQLAAYADGEMIAGGDFYVVDVLASEDETCELRLNEDTFYVPSEGLSDVEDASEEPQTEEATGDDETVAQEEAEADAEAPEEERLGVPGSVKVGLGESSSDHDLYIYLTGESAFVTITVTRRGLNEKYAITTVECEVGTTKVNLDDLDLKLPAGTWFLEAYVYEHEEVHTGTNQHVLYQVHQTGEIAEINKATPGHSDGSFRLRNEERYYHNSDDVTGSISYRNLNWDNYMTSARADTLITNLPAGTYEVRFNATTQTGSPKRYCAATEYKTFIIGEEPREVTKMEFTTDGEHVISSQVNMYKGATRIFPIKFNDGLSEPDDKRVKYESSDPSKVSVDANGNVKALKEVKPPELPVTIKATALSNGKTASLQIAVLGSITMKFAKSSLNVEKSAGVILDFTATKNTPNEFYVSSSDQSICEIASPFALTGYDASTGKGYLTINPSAVKKPGKVTITATYEATGQFTTCDVIFNGVYKPGTADMSVISGGKKMTGWIYLDDVKSTVTTKAKAKHIYYIDPVTGKPVNGLVKIGKDLYYFKDYEAYTAKEDQPAYMDYHEIYFGKGGKLLTGWQQHGTDRYYYDPETGIAVQYGFVPVGRGSGYVDNYVRWEEGITFIGSYYYYFEKGVIQTGWIYLNDADEKCAKSKATKWYYADPVTARISDTEGILTIGKKDYYISNSPSNGCIRHEAGFIDADHSSDVSAGDLYTGADGVIVVNKTVTSDGKTYYLGADGHPKTGMFLDGGKFVCTDSKGSGLNNCASLYICGDDNSGSATAFGFVSQKGEMLFYDDTYQTTQLKNQWLRTTSAEKSRVKDIITWIRAVRSQKGFRRSTGSGTILMRPPDFLRPARHCTIRT